MHNEKIALNNNLHVHYCLIQLQTSGEKAKPPISDTSLSKTKENLINRKVNGLNVEYGIYITLETRLFVN